MRSTRTQLTATQTFSEYNWHQSKKFIYCFHWKQFHEWWFNSDPYNYLLSIPIFKDYVEKIIANNELPHQAIGICIWYFGSSLLYILEFYAFFNELSVTISTQMYFNPSKIQNRFLKRLFILFLLNWIWILRVLVTSCNSTLNPHSSY